LFLGRTAPKKLKKEEEGYINGVSNVDSPLCPGEFREKSARTRNEFVKNLQPRRGSQRKGRERELPWTGRRLLIGKALGGVRVRGETRKGCLKKTWGALEELQKGNRGILHAWRPHATGKKESRRERGVKSKRKGNRGLSKDRGRVGFRDPVATEAQGGEERKERRVLKKAGSWKTN